MNDQSNHIPSTQDLSGRWSLRPDAADRGISERWFENVPSDGWLSAEVPSAWQSVFGTDESADPGIAWYRRSLTLKPVPAHARRFVRFDAVATDATVWIAGRKLDRHIGDWEMFEFELPPDLLTDSPIELLVRVDKIKAAPPVCIDGAPVQSGHITKGFHDVLSPHHGGIWGPVLLRTTGPVAIRPRGALLFPDAETGEVRVRFELYPHESRGELFAHLSRIAPHVESRPQTIAISPGQTVVECTLRVQPKHPQESHRVEHELWSPDNPVLYQCEYALRSKGAISESSAVRFGFRTVAAGGPNNQQILLNGKPTSIRGVLDWGHEPHHISPSPTREELSERLKRLRQMGFNAVCVCMWYPPEHYYDVADETGMLVWQEHPVWKPPMGDDLVEEYKRHFEHFFRRDVNHPSVVIVSGACEHERFNPKLAKWWWDRARELMPDRLLQVQTAFFAWSDLARTDLYDEHTYESSGRWTHYLDDLQHALTRLPTPKPFVMGESVLYNDWPDVPALLAASPRPWWYPKGLDDLAAAEQEITAKWGSEALTRFRQRAHRFNLRGRKFQWERFRQYPNHAGLVSNHLNDVWSCRCGYSDDLGRWRLEPQETRPWLADAIFLLRTPGGRSGFTSGYTIRAEIGLSNFGPRDFTGEIEVHVRQENASSIVRVPLACACGEVRFTPIEIRLAPVDRPTKVMLRTVVPGFDNNTWELWALPEPGALPAGVYRASHESDPTASELDFEELKYSSGWGLPNETWNRRSSGPSELIPAAPVWQRSAPPPADAQVVMTDRLTPEVLDFLEQGGKVLHFACKGTRSLPTEFLCMWGQVPLVAEDGMFEEGEGDWVCDLLDLDLTRLCTRAFATDKLSMAEHVRPIIRYLYVHDMADRVKRMDALFSTQVGEGTLVVSTLDHGEEGGQYLLSRILAWMLLREHADSPTISRKKLELLFK